MLCKLVNLDDLSSSFTTQSFLCPSAIFHLWMRMTNIKNLFSDEEKRGSRAQSEIPRFNICHGSTYVIETYGRLSLHSLLRQFRENLHSNVWATGEHRPLGTGQEVSSFYRSTVKNGLDYEACFECTLNHFWLRWLDDLLRDYRLSHLFHN